MDERHRFRKGTPPRSDRRHRAYGVAALLVLTAALCAPTPAAAAEPGAAKAAQRTISLGNFIVNRDLTALRGGRTATVTAACPGKTRFFTAGFFPFGIPRGAPRVNFILTAMVPRPNGIAFTFHNPAPLNSFPVNIRVSAMCLTLGTVSVPGARAASSDAGATTAKKKGKRKQKGKKKGKPKLKSRVLVKKVKVGKRKGKRKKGKKRAAASATRGTTVPLTCDRQRNEIPGGFGFQSKRSQFAGASPISRGGDVGLRGRFLTNGKDTVRFHLVCLQGQGDIALRARVGAGASAGARSAANGALPGITLNYHSPLGSDVPNADLIEALIRAVNFANRGNSAPACRPAPDFLESCFLPGMPPFPTGGSGWGGPCPSASCPPGNFLGALNQPNGSQLMLVPDIIPDATDPFARGTSSSLQLDDVALVQPVLHTEVSTLPVNPFPDCSDAGDNDLDGLFDDADPGCRSGPGGVYDPDDVSEQDLTGTGPCPSTGTFGFSGELENSGSEMIRHLLKIEGIVVVEKEVGDVDFDGGSLLITGVPCSGGTTVNVFVTWTRTGTTIEYDFVVEHVSGPGGDSFDKTITADTR